ncbi:MAG: PIN domain-containing protein [Candidatus Magnetoovum sp. WYHC-5]|nr:PIN domain-containing protein [Candidatus Magnetoovum sp. WYHC-5]
MKYLLDTNICIYLLNGNVVLQNKVKEIGVLSLAISNSVLAELYFGAYNSNNILTNLRRIEVFKRHLVVFSDTEESAKIFGKIKADLKNKWKTY